MIGKYRSAHDVQASRRKKSNQRYLTERGFRILDTLDAVSARLGVKPAQIALAWLVAQADVTAPIASATPVEQVEDLISAVQLPQGKSVLGLLNVSRSLAPHYDPNIF